MGICSSKKDYVSAKPYNHNNNHNNCMPHKNAPPSPHSKPSSNSAHKNQLNKNQNLFRLCNKKLESNPQQKSKAANCPTYQKFESSQTSGQEESFGMLLIQENLLQSKLFRTTKQKQKQALYCSKTLTKQMKQNYTDEKNQPTITKHKSQLSQNNKPAQAAKNIPTMLTIKRRLESTQELAQNGINLLN